MLEAVLTQGLVDWVWEKRAVIFLSWPGLGTTSLHICSGQNSLDTATQGGSGLPLQPTLATKGQVQVKPPLKGIPYSCSPGLVSFALTWCLLLVEWWCPWKPAF